MDLSVKYSAKKIKKSNIFHSSGYARVQNGKNIGAADSSTFADRQSIEARRKYIQKYRNSKILQGAYAAQRAKTYTPRVEKAANVAQGRGTLVSEEQNGRRGNRSGTSPTITPPTSVALAARQSRPIIASGRPNAPSFMSSGGAAPISISKR